MTLSYKGSVREFRGMGMVSNHFENKIDTSLINQKHRTAVNDTYIVINEAKGDEVSFSFYFFDKESRYIIHQGETVNHKHEGNAFGFEFTFTLNE